MKKLSSLFMMLLAMTFVISSCKDNEEPDPNDTPLEVDNSLYGVLGGDSLVTDPNSPNTQIELGRLNLRAVVDSTIFIIAADDRLNPYFQVLLAEVGEGDLTGFSALSTSLTDFFAVATGSQNANYTGMNMSDAHNPTVNSRMAFSANNDAMDAFIEDVVAGAAQNGVTDSDIISPIGELLESLRTDVVQRADGDPRPLYVDLGGEAMVSDPNDPNQMIEQGRLNLRAVVDSTIFVIAADDRLNPYFQVLLAEVGEGELSGFSALSESLTDFFCVATGARNYTYTGLNMQDAHDPEISSRMAFAADDDAMDAFIEDVVAGAAQNGVNDEGLVGRVGALLESVRGDVVQRTETLYDRLGGTEMVADPNISEVMIEQGRLTFRAVVDSTIFVIAGDDRLQPYFETLLAEVGNNDLSGFAALSSSLTDFFCVAAGAESQSYTGLDMVEAHDPAQNSRMALKADDAAMDAFIEDAVQGLAQNGVTVENNGPLVNEIGALINSLRGAIVQR